MRHRTVLAAALAAFGSSGACGDAGPSSSSGFCEEIDDIELTGAADTRFLGVGIAVVDGGLVATVGSDWNGRRYDRALELFDVSAPAQPTRLGSLEEPGQASAVAIEGDHAFVVDPLLGLVVVDIADPREPVRVGQHEQLGGIDVELAGSLALLSFSNPEGSGRSGLAILDLRDPAAPKLVGDLLVDGSVRGLGVKGDRVYLTHEHAVRIVDIADPTDPVEVAVVETDEPTFNVHPLDDRIAYVANFGAGIGVLDVEDPSSPELVASVPTDIVNYDLTVAGDHVYVPDDMLGLKILDIRDPSAPEVVGSYRPPGWARDVVVVENHAYVAEFLHRSSGRLTALRLCGRDDTAG